MSTCTYHELTSSFGVSCSMTTICRMDYIALATVPCTEFPRLVHVHMCPDATAPSFPFGPLLREVGVCDEPIPLCCAFCGRITEQSCRRTYRVADTGADWNDFRDEVCHHKDLAVLVGCVNCDAPSDFHIQIALFKEYYEEVFDKVRAGRLSLFDLRRSVTVVSSWPPRPAGELLRRLSHLASQVSDALPSDLALPVTALSLVMEYWQGVTEDYLSPKSSFALSLGMYECTHVWPCVNHQYFARPCLWTRWSQHWIHELHLCDSRLYNPYRHERQLPRTWDEWVTQRQVDWKTPPTRCEADSIGFVQQGLQGPGALTHFYNSFDGGAEFLQMASTSYHLSNYFTHPSHPDHKPEDRKTDGWYIPASSHVMQHSLVGYKMKGSAT